jgi:hypothetical protein
MRNTLQVRGARAKVYLKYADGLSALAKQLSDGLNVPELTIETDQYPPHEYFGRGEALGFCIWLHNSRQLPEFNFLIQIETKHNTEESFDDKMYDLSLWLARYISEILDIESFVDTPSNRRNILLDERDANVIESK